MSNISLSQPKTRFLIGRVWRDGSRIVRLASAGVSPIRGPFALKAVIERSR